MKWKTWLPLALALALGLVAAKLAKDFIARSRNNTAVVNMAAVVVVTRDIAPGEELSEKDLGVESTPAGNLPAGTFSQIPGVVGRISEARIVKGQMLLESMLAPPEARSGLQALVPAGLRALTIEVNEFSGVAGHLAPGCRVDVIATIQDPATHEYFTKTIAQAVPITAVGRRPVANDGGGENSVPARSVTLLVSPQQAELIQLTSIAAKCSLVLRGSRDRGNTTSDGLSIGDIIGARHLAKAPQPRQQPEVEPVRQVNVAPATRPITADAATRPGVAQAALPRPKRTVEVIVGASATTIEMPVEDRGHTVTGADLQGVAPEPRP